jgi:hypothetical protein
MRKITFLLGMIFLIMTNFSLKGQSYVPLSLSSGFNNDLIANGNSTSAATTNVSDGFDGDGAVYYGTDFVSTITGSPGSNGCSTGLSSSISSPWGPNYNIPTFNNPNCLYMLNQGDGGTLVFTNSGSFQKLALLASSSNHPGSSAIFDAVVHFSDGSTYTTTFSAADWVIPSGTNGTDYFIALSPQTGRVNRTRDSYDACGTTKLFDCFIDLTGYTNKVVTSIYCHKTSSTTQRCAIFAVCGVTALGSPKPPVTITATSVTGTSFQANWNPASSDPYPATSYVLDISTDPNFSVGTFIGVFNNYNVGNILTYSVPGLTSNTTYYYRVRGVNAQGQSVNSNVTPVTTLNPVPLPPVATAATNVTKNSFQANWTPASSDPYPATSYVLDVSTDQNFIAGSFVGVFNNYNVGNVLTYSVPGINSSTTYYYRVRGVNAQGQSANSNVITVITLDIPTLSQWGLIILGFLFLAFGTIYIRRWRGTSV